MKNTVSVEIQQNESLAQPKTQVKDQQDLEVRNINVIFEQSVQLQISIPCKEEHKITCVWLRQEISKRINQELQMRPGMKPLSTELILETMPRNILLDYWLSLPQKTVFLLEEGQTLFARRAQPAKQSGLSRTNVSLKDFEILSKIGWGGFSPNLDCSAICDS